MERIDRKMTRATHTKHSSKVTLDIVKDVIRLTNLGLGAREMARSNYVDAAESTIYKVRKAMKDAQSNNAAIVLEQYDKSKAEDFARRQGKAAKGIESEISKQEYGITELSTDINSEIVKRLDSILEVLRQLNEKW